MAMGVLQALKLQKGSLREIAMLPQQQIMVMAQRGQIPAAMVPIVLSEKAQMAKEAQAQQAMMQAQQPSPPTVTEQNMQAIQGAEDEEAMRRRMMAGVGSLPVQDDTFRAAGGGIVAFARGGDLPEDEEEERVDIVAPSATYESQLARAKKSLALPEEAQAYLKYLEGQSARSAAQAEQDKYMNLINLGARIMGGTSPYAFTNIGKGISESMPDFARSAQAQRAAEAEALKGRAQMALSRNQAEAELASKLYTTEAGLSKAEIAARNRLEIAQLKQQLSTSTGQERMAKVFAVDMGLKKFGKPWEELTDAQRANLLAAGQEKVLSMAAEIRNQPAFARLPYEATRTTTDVEQAITQDRKANQDIFDDAKLPLDDKTPPYMRAVIERAREQAASLEQKYKRMRDEARGRPSASSEKAEAPAKGGTAAPAKKTPSLSEFLEKARKANPGVKDSELEAYWKKTYGG